MKIRKDSRGQAEFSWIFALIVGALILFFAFYFIGSKLLEGNLTKSLMTEHSLDILFNPFSYFGSLGATSAKTMDLSTVEKINFSCKTEEVFGYDSITVWTKEATQPRKVYDKYLFSDRFIESKNFQIISKSFNMPWRVADLVYFFPRNIKYCFIGPNFDDTRKEFGSDESDEHDTGMNISNFYFPESINLCPPDGEVVNICGENGASNSKCDIIVYSGNDNYVLKKNDSGVLKKLYYSDDAQMYAAIFSDPEVYYCNMQRLTKRLQYQIEIYNAKMQSLNQGQNCGMYIPLDGLDISAKTLFDNIEGSKQNIWNPIKGAFSDIKSKADVVKYQNDMSACKLF
ncbi:MAG: hypothetical protein NTX24_01580 [Candidatus Pacearchaeota archaeon]|nr:hypothetical protein [Candidatus Pacearchaeota archaeon]